MRIYIVIVLVITVSFLNNAGAKDEKKPVLISAEELCSKLSSNENAFKTSKGTGIKIYGKLSSVGDKRKAYLGNRMDSVVDLVITPQPKNFKIFFMEGKKIKNGEEVSEPLEERIIKRDVKTWAPKLH